MRIVNRVRDTTSNRKLPLETRCWLLDGRRDGIICFKLAGYAEDTRSPCEHTGNVFETAHWHEFGTSELKLLVLFTLLSQRLCTIGEDVVNKARCVSVLRRDVQY